MAFIPNEMPGPDPLTYCREKRMGSIYPAQISNQREKKNRKTDYLPGKTTQMADFKITHSFLSVHFKKVLYW